MPKEPVIPKRPRRILNVHEAAGMIQKAWRRHIVSTCISLNIYISKNMLKLYWFTVIVVKDL